MKLFRFLKNDIFYVFIVSLLLGLIIGVVAPSKHYAELRIFIHKLYLKFNPNAEKDSKTIILETASKSLDELPQNSIFDKPKKKNKVILFIKQIIESNKKPQEDTINNIKFD